MLNFMQKRFHICLSLLISLITGGCTGLGYQPTYIISDSEDKPAQAVEPKIEEKRQLK